MATPPSSDAILHKPSQRWTDPVLGIVYGLGTGHSPGIYATHDDAGYIVFGRLPKRFAHIVIWEAVHGPVPSGHEINHIDFVRDHNTISNLEAVTHGDNVRHSARAGRSTAKLTPAQVRTIRASTTSPTELARLYGVTRQTIGDIRARRPKAAWAWID